MYLEDINVLIRPAVSEDSALIGPLLRRSDVSELFASSGLTAVEAVRQSIEASQGGFCKIAVNGDSKPILIWGVATSSDTHVGVPWMVATDLIYRPDYLCAFKKLCAEEVATMNKQFPLLINYVDHRNVTSILWLQALGFTFIELVPNYGHGKLPFWKFMRASNNV